MRKLLIGIAWTIAAGLVLLASIAWYFDVPLVSRSTLTGECVSVEHPSRQYTCETVPSWPQVTRWVR